MTETVNGSSVTIDQIFNLLPHRYPFLLVDRVEDMVGEETATGIKNVTHSEPWFTGHFPNHPVFPGVLIVEAIAQTAAILVLQHSIDTGKPIEANIIYFMAVDKARFRAPVRPGDQMRIYVEKIRRRGEAYKFKGLAKVDGKLVAEAEIMATNYTG